MKQHIDLSDLNQLSEKGKQKLREWWKPESTDLVLLETSCTDPDCIHEPHRASFYADQLGFQIIELNKQCLPLLSIGQCIELLNTPYMIPVADEGNTYWVVNIKHNDDELCDALWSAVKEELER